MPLVSFSPGQVISSANVNANFALCVLTDTSRTITVTHTFSASQTFSAGWTSSAGVTVSSGTTAVQALTATTLALSGNILSDLLFTDATYDIGKTGATRPRDLFMSRNLTVGGTANVAGVLNSSSCASFYGTGFPVNIGQGPTIEIRAGNILSFDRNLGTFQTLAYSAISHAFNVGHIILGPAASKIVPGATSFTFRNNADTQDNFAIVDAGDVTIGRGNLTVSIGNFIITGVAGTLQIGGNQVIGPRLTGYTNAWTGAAANKATGYDASTITLPQLAARVRALQESLTTHGLIGV